MQTAQRGDRVQIHYVRRFEDGSRTTSRDGQPVELTVGIDHPRLPGLGNSLVGLTPGASALVQVSADQAFGLPDPKRVQRWARRRFPKDQALPVGKWVKFQTSQGKNRMVRIVKVQEKMVVVDTNRRWAGQAMEIEVELIAIQSGQPSSVVVDPEC